MSYHKSQGGKRKAIRVCIRKITGVLYSLQQAPLTDREWEELNELYRLLGKVRSANLDWKASERGT